MLSDPCVAVSLVYLQTQANLHIRFLQCLPDLAPGVYAGLFRRRRFHVDHGLAPATWRRRFTLVHTRSFIYYHYLLVNLSSSPHRRSTHSPSTVQCLSLTSVSSFLRTPGHFMSRSRVTGQSGRSRKRSNGRVLVHLVRKDSESFGEAGSSEMRKRLETYGRCACALRYET